MSAVSILLVAAQLGALAALFATGPWIARGAAGLVLEVAGLALGAWAIAAMRPTRLRVLPEPAPGARLVTRGPYRFIRHPMYSALLLLAAGLLVDFFSLPRFGVAGALLVILVAKITREERFLARHFPEYAAYRTRTKRLLPFVY